MPRNTFVKTVQEQIEESIIGKLLQDYITPQNQEIASLKEEIAALKKEFDELKKKPRN